MDYWLRDVGTAPNAITYYGLGDGYGQGRRATAFPPTTATTLSLYLHDDSLETTPPTGASSWSYMHDPMDPVPSLGGSIMWPFPLSFSPIVWPFLGPWDQAPLLNRSDVRTLDP